MYNTFNIFFQTLRNVNQHQQKKLTQLLTVANKSSDVRLAVGTHGESKNSHGTHKVEHRVILNGACRQRMLAEGY